MIEGPTGHLLMVSIHVNASLLAFNQTVMARLPSFDTTYWMAPPEHIRLPASARPISVRAGDGGRPRRAGSQRLLLRASNGGVVPRSRPERRLGFAPTAAKLSQNMRHITLGLPSPERGRSAVPGVQNVVA